MSDIEYYGFDKLQKELDKSIVIPCCLRAEDFECRLDPAEGDVTLESVILGLRKRWRPDHTTKIHQQLE